MDMGSIAHHSKFFVISRTLKKVSKYFFNIFKLVQRPALYLRGLVTRNPLDLQIIKGVFHLKKITHKN